MGNRMIKESIRTDLKINKLNDFQFRLWTYLITYVDDYGRGSADPDLVKGFCFPRRKAVTAQTIAAGFKDLEEIGLVKIYRVEEEDYFFFPTWEKHQRIQAKKSFYPESPKVEDCQECNNSTVGHGEPRKPTVTHGNPPLTTESYGNPPPEVEVEVEVEVEEEYSVLDIYSVSNKSNIFSISAVGTELEISDSAAAAAEQKKEQKETVIFELTTNTGEVYPFTQTDIDKYKGLYPAVDIMQEFRKMIGWLDANPSKRKTKTGMRRFVNSWLAREQDKGGAYNSNKATPPALGTKFSNFQQRQEDLESDMSNKFMRELEEIHAKSG